MQGIDNMYTPSQTVQTCLTCGGPLTVVQLTGNSINADGSCTTDAPITWSYCEKCSPVSQPTYDRIVSPDVGQWDCGNGYLMYHEPRIDHTEQLKFPYVCKEYEGSIKVYLDTGFGEGIFVAEFSPKEAEKFARELKKLAKKMQKAK